MTNTRCPAPESHYENATERMFPDWYLRPKAERVLSATEHEAVQAEADREYRMCEGHD